MLLVGHDLVDRVQDAIKAGQVVVFKLRAGVRGMDAAHAQDGRVKVEEGLLGDVDDLVAQLSGRQAAAGVGFAGSATPVARQRSSPPAKLRSTVPCDVKYILR